jgi:hypothetical protein
MESLEEEFKSQMGSFAFRMGVNQAKRENNQKKRRNIEKRCGAELKPTKKRDRPP